METQEHTRVLLVENDNHVASLVTALLAVNADPYRSCHVTDVDTALEETAKGEADIVLVGIEMPGYPGLDALYSIHTHVPELPLLVVSRAEDPELAKDSYHCGAQEFLVVPQLSVPCLARAITTAIERKQIERELQQTKTEAQTAAWYEHEAKEALERQIAERQRLEKELKNTILSLEQSNSEKDALNDQLQKSEAKLREVNKQLGIQASTDPLTGLHNRRHAEEMLDKEMARVSRGKQHLGLALIDLDHFKNVNDTYGHDAGDMVLVEVSRRLKRATRTYDGLVRWGGEEILIICPETDTEQIQCAAQRFLDTIGTEQIDIGEELISITASIGAVSSHSAEGLAGDGLIAQCDNALYEAKNTGRNRVVMARRLENTGS